MQQPSKIYIKTQNVRKIVQYRKCVLALNRGDRPRLIMLLNDEGEKTYEGPKDMFRIVCAYLKNGTNVFDKAKYKYQKKKINLQ